MKSYRKIVIIILVVFLSLSIGYALFSETLTISGTASAGGDFKITASCERPSEFDEYYFKDKGYENDICSVNGTNVKLSVDLKYPGATRLFTVKFTNSGGSLCNHKYV